MMFILGILALLCVVAWRVQNILNSFEYREVLSYHTWKSVTIIKKEMEMRKGHQLSLERVHKSLVNLKILGDAERRYEGMSEQELADRDNAEEFGEIEINTEFKLNFEGGRKKKRLKELRQWWPFGQLEPVPI